MSQGWLEWKKSLKTKSAKIADVGEGEGEKKEKAKNSK